MQPQAASYSSCSCATLRFLIDPSRDITVPVGVLLWDSQGEWWKMRLPQEEEKIADLTGRSASAILEATRTQLDSWIRSGDTPYADRSLKPLTYEWWLQVQRLLKFSVRLDTIRPVDCREPDIEIDTLFEAIVQPQISSEEKTERIDFAVSRALGHWTKYFHRGEVPGFGGRAVPVLRQANTSNGLVIVEAVNLAALTAEKDADALFGQLSRIRSAETTTRSRFVLGYLASPNGLNGERPLKEFIEAKIDTPMFDLTRQREDFQQTAANALQEMRGAEGLFSVSTP